jgi:hypothetical protein
LESGKTAGRGCIELTAAVDGIPPVRCGGSDTLDNFIPCDCGKRDGMRQQSAIGERQPNPGRAPETAQDLAAAHGWARCFRVDCRRAPRSVR